MYDFLIILVSWSHGASKELFGSEEASEAKCWKDHY